MKRQSGRVAERIWFYNLGLGAEDYVDGRKWEIRTLDRIMRDLKHENVCIILKTFLQPKVVLRTILFITLHRCYARQIKGLS